MATKKLSHTYVVYSPLGRPAGRVWKGQATSARQAKVKAEVRTGKDVGEAVMVLDDNCSCEVCNGA